MAAIRNRHLGLIYVAPALLFVSAFVLYPLGQLVWLSLTDTSLLGGGTWVGLENYAEALDDRAFWRALWFTVKYTVVITPILMGLGFALALLTSQNTPLKLFTRATIFLPVVIGLGTSSLLWYWLLDQQVGLFNKILLDLGLVEAMPVWFTKADPALAAVIVSVTWKVVGFGMILFVAAIQSINSEVIEAAIIDGASYWQRVWRIIIPLSMRTLLLATLISAIGSMLAFEQFYIMTGGNPRGQTFTSVYLIYQNSFISFKLGYGAALSIILTAIILVFSALQVFLSNRSASE
ncbi:MAG: sugar ABC transporter permease [Candidatus Devosia phytovorans]|uniref:Sugar ABC transporter permease n=1 Tax=Candidatus Devosia phytovorans TaxID=3121372 RepID=A0AAJ5VSW8_9HYPH|nr:sugar ABC transporter permease [Devosia sp.]WEK03300.1 MAG: sugar ABC transporter permease [Devosia sp.]